ncbi:hypothetical protein C8Q77DRAFT_1102185 [Trametes polyzona]|nr:hypothetical protein C8Q77DRAFT_1102185 [Trametes polyzona]
MQIRQHVHDVPGCPLYGSLSYPISSRDALQGNLSCCVVPLLHGHVRGLLSVRDVPDRSDEDHWLASDESLAQWEH